MKKTIALLGALLSFCAISAQETGTVSLFANANYNFEETVPYDLADLKIKDGLQWGGGVEYFFDRINAIEFKYNRMDTDFAVKGFLNGQSKYETSSGSLQYYMLG